MGETGSMASMIGRSRSWPGKYFSRLPEMFSTFGRSHQMALYLRVRVLVSEVSSWPKDDSSGVWNHKSETGVTLSFRIEGFREWDMSDSQSTEERRRLEGRGSGVVAA